MPQGNKNSGQPKRPNPPGSGQRPGQPPQPPPPAKLQGFAEEKRRDASWTNNEIQMLKQLASENAPVSTMSSKLRKSEDAIRAKAKELEIKVTSW
jgi:hypothetical protein